MIFFLKKGERESYLERLLDLDLERDLDTDLPYRLYGEGEGEYLWNEN